MKVIAGTIFLLLGAAISAIAQSQSSCDVNHDNQTTVLDIQAVVNEAMGAATPADDLDGDGATTVVDVAIALNAVLGRGCSTDLIPTIVSLTPKAALSGTPFTLTVTGKNFTGATFAFAPALPISSIVINSAGTLVTLTVSPAAAVRGYYTLLGTNSVGTSFTYRRVGFLPGVKAFNTISLPGSSATADADSDGLTNAQELTLGTDPLNPDTDYDLYPDGLEVLYSSDPLDPASRATIPVSANNLVSPAFSLENRISPAPSTPQTYIVTGLSFSAMNSGTPASGPQTYAISSLTFSTRNTTSPIPNSPQTYAITGLTFSALNSLSPLPVGPQTYVLNGLAFSVFNGLTSSQAGALSAVTDAAPNLASLRFVIPTDPALISVMLARGAHCVDTDGDGICDADELILGTNPFLADSDGDGYPDGLELALGSDPLNPKSIPDIRPPGYLVTPAVSIQITRSQF